MHIMHATIFFSFGDERVRFFIDLLRIQFARQKQSKVPVKLVGSLTAYSV